MTLILTEAQADALIHLIEADKRDVSSKVAALLNEVHAMLISEEEEE